MTKEEKKEIVDKYNEIDNIVKAVEQLSDGIKHLSDSLLVILDRLQTLKR